MDGATLTRSMGIVAAGVKLIDVSVVDPVSGEFCNIPTSTNCLIQSRERCFPLKITLAKDCSETYEVFSEFYQFMADLSTDCSTEEDEKPKNKVYPESHPCQLSSTADMVGHNKATKKEVVLTLQNIFVYTAMKQGTIVFFRGHNVVPKHVRCVIKREMIGFVIISLF